MLTFGPGNKYKSYEFISAVSKALCHTLQNFFVSIPSNLHPSSKHQRKQLRVKSYFTFRMDIISENKRAYDVSQISVAVTYLTFALC